MNSSLKMRALRILSSQARYFARDARKKGIPSLNLLDSHISNSNSNKKNKGLNGKLGRNLATPPVPILDHASEGILESLGGEIADVLNEALSNNKSWYILKNCRETSEVLEFEDAIMNKDYSHVKALWRCPVLEQFIDIAYQKHGQEYAEKITETVVSDINSSLEKREGFYRSFLIRKMDFKRVPRISFHAKDPSFGINDQLLNYSTRID